MKNSLEWRGTLSLPLFRKGLIGIMNVYIFVDQTVQ